MLDSTRSTVDQQRSLYECLKEDGWDATFDEASGTFITDVPEAQSEVYDDALDTCSESLNYDFDKPLTAEQMQAIYGWYTEIANCLSTNNWPSPEKPSFQTFSDTYDSNPWIPWIEVPADEMALATEKCPSMSQPGS